MDCMDGCLLQCLMSSPRAPAVMLMIWGTSLPLAVLFGGFYLLIEGGFLTANLFKVSWPGLCVPACPEEQQDTLRIHAGSEWRLVYPNDGVFLEFDHADMVVWDPVKDSSP